MSTDDITIRLVVDAGPTEYPPEHDDPADIGGCSCWKCCEIRAGPMAELKRKLNSIQ